MCRISDDCIDPKRYPLFIVREVVCELLAQFKTKSKVDAKVSTCSSSCKPPQILFLETGVSLQF